MYRCNILSPAFYILLSLFLSCKTTSSKIKDSETKENPSSYDDRFRSFIDRNFKERISRDPAISTFYGFEADHGAWPDISLDGIRTSHELSAKDIQDLKSFDRTKLNNENQLNYDLLLNDLQLSKDGEVFRSYLRPFDPLGGLHIIVPIVLETTAKSSLAGIADFKKRLSGLEYYYANAIALMQEGLRVGITMPAPSIERVLSQIEPLTSRGLQSSRKDANLSVARTHPFYEMAQSATQDPQVLREIEGIINDRIMRAYDTLYEFLSAEYLPRTTKDVGIFKQKNGRKWYNHLIKTQTSTSFDAEYIYDLGLQEVDRIYKRFEAVKSQSGFQGSMQEFFEFMHHDPSFKYPNKEALVQAYKDLHVEVERLLPKYFHRFPKTNLAIVEMPASSQPGSPVAVYSTGSTVDNRPGQIKLNTYEFRERRPTWERTEVYLHEGQPGHHFEKSLAQENSDLPLFRRYSSQTAYSEGWALYCEALGEEMGLYKDPYQLFGRLNAEMLRAVRLVVDTGIHAKGWTRERAIQYFIEKTGKPQSEAATEIDRYISNPGQALSYKMGEIKIRRVRESIEQRLGEKFDLAKFHEAVLENGPLPLNILESKVQKKTVGTKIRLRGAKPGCHKVLAGCTGAMQ